MSTVLQDASGESTLLASEANLCAAWTDIGCALPGELHDTPDMFRFRSGLPSPFWNAVFRARLTEESADAQIDATLRYFTAPGLSMFWWLTCSSQPSDLGARLEAHGFTHSLSLEDMVADLRSIPDSTPMPEDCHISEVTTQDELAQANQIVATSFGASEEIGRALTTGLVQAGFGGGHPWHIYIALANGRPVAAASLHLKHGVAGIYNVATVPESRRQGFGTAVTLAGLHFARSLGYRVAILHASDMGVPVYRRLGFEARHEIPLYLWSGPAKSTA